MINYTEIIVALVTCGTLGFIAHRVIKAIRHASKLKNTPPFEDLMKNLELVLANEIASYERMLDYSTDGVDLDGFISNSQFINIYNDLSRRVIYSLSDDFYYLMSTYLTEDEVQSYIAQRIYLYLATKAVPNDEDETEEDEAPKEEYGDEFGEY